MAPGPKLLLKERSTRSRSRQAPQSASSRRTARAQVEDQILAAPRKDVEESAHSDPAQTLAQSVKTVQQVIFGCASNLSGARSIFRADCYEPMDYEFDSTQTDEGATATTVPLRAKFVGLKRGVSTKVDSFLNLLVSRCYLYL